MDFLSSLHPVFVHFPIAIFFVYLLFEIFNTVYKRGEFETTTILLLFMGVLSAIVAVLTGNQAATVAREIHEHKTEVLSLLDDHENYATLALWLFTGLLFFKFFVFIRKKQNIKSRLILLAAAIIGMLLIYETGKTGGLLVFRYGIGIG